MLESCKEVEEELLVGPQASCLRLITFPLICQKHGSNHKHGEILRHLLTKKSVLSYLDYRRKLQNSERGTLKDRKHSTTMPLTLL